MVIGLSAMSFLLIFRILLDQSSKTRFIFEYKQVWIAAHAVLGIPVGERGAQMFQSALFVPKKHVDYSGLIEDRGVNRRQRESAGYVRLSLRCPSEAQAEN